MTIITIPSFSSLSDIWLLEFSCSSSCSVLSGFNGEAGLAGLSGLIGLAGLLGLVRFVGLAGLDGDIVSACTVEPRQKEKPIMAKITVRVVIIFFKRHLSHLLTSLQV